MAKEKDPFENSPPACKGCVRWPKFGKGCHYYWEHKKHCTMWAQSWEDVAQQQTSAQ